jgi:hypothetical protein
VTWATLAVSILFALFLLCCHVFAFTPLSSIAAFVLFHYTSFTMWILYHASVLAVWATQLLVDVESTETVDQDSSDSGSGIITRPIDMQDTGWDPVHLHALLTVRQETFSR